MLPNKMDRIDHETIELAKLGDEAAISKIVNKFQSYLSFVANSRMEPSLAGFVSPSDVVRDTIAGLPQKIGAFVGESEQELRAWLRASLCNTLKNAQRFHLQEKRSVANEKDLPSSRFENCQSPSKQMESMARAAIVEKGLKEISDEDQKVLRMRHQEGMTFVEMGKALSVSADAARMSWARAIERLKTHLSKYGDL